MRLLTLLLFIALGSEVQKIKINNTAEFNLPDDAKVTNENEVRKKVKAQNKKSVLFFQNKNSHFYVFKNMRMEASTDIRKGQGKLLDNRMKVFGMYDKEKLGQFNARAEFMIFAGRKVLILYYDKKDFSYYRFYTASSSDDKGFSGTLEFDKKDAGAAKEIMYTLLNSLKFI